MKLLHGDSAARLVSERLAAPVADLTTLKGLPGKRLVHGMTALVTGDMTQWVWHSTTALTGDDVLVAKLTDGSAGAWLREPGAVELKLPFTFATADAAVLLTMQAGQLLRIAEFYWQIDADMTGGAASAIGVSSTKNDSADFSTKGDLLGGAAGDVAATLTAALGTPYARGTIGVDWDTVAKRRTLWKPADILRFDRITSAFAAGSGKVLVVGELLRNAGA